MNFFSNYKTEDGKINHRFLFLFALSVVFLLFIFVMSGFASKSYDYVSSEIKRVAPPPPPPKLDRELYDKKLLENANLSQGSTTTSEFLKNLWPVKAAYPIGGAILPFKRVVAYYGNLYSRQMGALGEYPEEEMKQRLMAEVKKWEIADPNTPVVPALHYIAITAQASAGDDKKYRLRMPFTEIDKVLKMAESINAIVFLDIQVGLSNVQNEVPIFEKYLKMPNVHFGVDPEFYMKGGEKPGTVIGSMDAEDINFVTEYLAKIVKENNLPPKILVIHRFTQNMITNYKQIITRPEVQIVIDMDGWGLQARKVNTYNTFVQSEPIQFTGFKLFYKNDFREKGSRIMTPEEVLELQPKPIYIQYQ